PRWRYLKDLTGITDEKSLLKSYDKRTQWSVKRAASMGVHVRELGEDELQVFADIEQATAERRNFEYRGEAYFRKFKQAYGSKAHFMVAQIHIGRPPPNAVISNIAVKPTSASSSKPMAAKPTSWWRRFTSA
ncbi:peptidoglycan bridge formation glycyltransferase FemA/FemB family protein, partial [Algiphilus sp. NNCM1]|nr:peptidoglycan bridge formation glycyltransferase FemA/FemB family protein [Algiphilus acroporae]